MRYNADKTRRSRIVTVRTMRKNSFSLEPTTELHIYCPESTASVCLAFLMLLHASMTRPTMLHDRLHGPLDRMKCIVSTQQDLLQLLRIGKSTTVVLHYQLQGSTCTIETDDESFHGLLCHIRHTVSEYVGKIRLDINRHFWDLAHWKEKEGVKEVMRQNSLRNDPSKSQHPNFLKDIAKIAAPADRWLDDEDYIGSDRTTEGDDYEGWGTQLQITIDGTDSPEKDAFLLHLGRYIEKCREARPLISGRSRYTVTAAERRRFGF